MQTNQPASQPRGSRKQRERHGEVQDFLNHLAHALTTGDSKRVATMWGTPAYVIGADDVVAVASRDEVEKFFAGAKAQYNEHGIVDTRADIRDEEWISDDLVVVKVRWPYFDAKRREIGAESSDYTLRRNADGKLEVRAVLMRGAERG